MNFRSPDSKLLLWPPKISISSAHAAEILDVSIQTVCRMIADGTLKAYQARSDRRTSPFRINYDSLMAHIETIHQKSAIDKRF